MEFPPVIDKAILENLKVELGDDFVAEIVTTFFADSTQLLSDLQRALFSRDAPSFTRHAHSLKSTSLTFGGVKFSELARQFEMLGRESKLDEAEEMLGDLVAAHGEMVSQLKELCYE